MTAVLTARKRQFYLTLDADALEADPTLSEEGKRPALLFRPLTVAEMRGLAEAGEGLVGASEGSGSYEGVLCEIRTFLVAALPAWIGVKGNLDAFGEGDGGRLVGLNLLKMTAEERADLLLGALSMEELTRLAGWLARSGKVEDAEKKP